MKTTAIPITNSSALGIHLFPQSVMTTTMTLCFRFSAWKATKGYLLLWALWQTPLNTYLHKATQENWSSLTFCPSSHRAFVFIRIESHTGTDTQKKVGRNLSDVVWSLDICPSLLFHGSPLFDNPFLFILTWHFTITLQSFLSLFYPQRKFNMSLKGGGMESEEPCMLWYAHSGHQPHSHEKGLCCWKTYPATLTWL